MVDCFRCSASRAHAQFLTGVISGTPLASGNYSYTAQATDSLGMTAQITCSIGVGAPNVPVVNCPSTTVFLAGQAYSIQVRVTGGTAPFTYALTAGSLPTGMSLNTSTGVISGTPTVTQTVSYTITVTDANGEVVPTPSCPANVITCPAQL